MQIVGNAFAQSVDAMTPRHAPQAPGAPRLRLRVGEPREHVAGHARGAHQQPSVFPASSGSAASSSGCSSSHAS